jgi:mono/diheme cytochrome c family protein
MRNLDSALVACGMTVAAIFALSTPAYSSGDAAGKATYESSCAKCHGEAGIGSSVSDKFWKMRIPRLNSEYVQKKSNEELTTVILNGKRKMPPAMAGSPETGHQTKVTAAQVPDLIVYIRSLKSL